MSIANELLTPRYVEFVSVYYELDGSFKKVDLETCENETFHIWANYTKIQHTRLKFSENLTGLSDGIHSFRVSASGTSYATWPIPPSRGGGYEKIYSKEVSSYSGRIYFTVDATPPTVSNLSIENKTYDYNATIPLSFTVDKPSSWLTYSMDGQANVTIVGNTTLTGLSHGSHTLTVYANDTVGNIGASETITFSIAEEPEQEPFPTAYSIGIVTVIVAILLGSTVYIMKRKH